MIVADISSVRRWIGRLERGDRLPDVFLQFAQAHDIETASIQAIGAFEHVEVCEYDQTTQRYRDSLHIEACEVLSLKGNISLKDGNPFVHLHATVSKERAGTVEVFGGHLVSATVFALEFQVDAYPNVALHRAKDAATGLHLWAEGTRDVDSEVPTELTWELAAALSEEADRASQPALSAMPGRGDWIEHPKFGLCRIEALSDDGVMVIKLPDARRKKIKLERLELLAPRRDKNRTIYPVRPRAR